MPPLRDRARVEKLVLRRFPTALLRRDPRRGYHAGRSAASLSVKILSFPLRPARPPPHHLQAEDALGYRNPVDPQGERPVCERPAAQTGGASGIWTGRRYVSTHFLMYRPLSGPSWQRGRTSGAFFPRASPPRPLQKMMAERPSQARARGSSGTSPPKFPTPTTLDPQGRS